MFGLSFFVVAFTLAGTAVLVIAQAYIRWKLNQNFAFLPGFGLETIVFSAFALLSVMTYRYGVSAKE